MFNQCKSTLTCLLFAAATLALAFNGAIAGPKAYVGNFKDDTVSVVDTTAAKVIATVPVARGPHGMAVMPDGWRVYVSGDNSSSVSVIDTATDRVVETIEVGKSPHGLAMTPDGRWLLVAVNGEDRVAFINTATQQVVGSVAVAKPHTIAISPDGKTAYVASQDPSRFAIVPVDLTARTAMRVIALDKPPRDLEFGHDGKALYFTKAGVNAVQVLDPASDKIVAEIPTGVSPHYANFFAKTTLGIVVVQGANELLLFDPATNQPVRHLAVGKQPHWVTVSGDGKTAYVPNEGSNDFSIVDLATGKTVTIPMGNAPRKVVVQPSQNRTTVSISNFLFVPPVITVTAGETVVWSNDDGAPHGVAFRDGSKGAQSILPGQTFGRVFDQPGSYEYSCSFHSYMTGRVNVLSPSGERPPKAMPARS